MVAKIWGFFRENPQILATIKLSPIKLSPKLNRLLGLPKSPENQNNNIL